MISYAYVKIYFAINMIEFSVSWRFSSGCEAASTDGMYMDDYIEMRKPYWHGVREKVKDYLKL